MIIHLLVFQAWPAFELEYASVILFSGITIRNAHCPDKSCGTRRLVLKSKLAGGAWTDQIIELPDPRQYETVPLGKT